MTKKAEKQEQETIQEDVDTGEEDNILKRALDGISEDGEKMKEAGQDTSDTEDIEEDTEQGTGNEQNAETESEDDDDLSIKIPEDVSVPEWVRDLKTKKELEAANYFGGGKKPDWIGKGYDKMTDSERSAINRARQAKQDYEEQQVSKQSQSMFSPEDIQTAQKKIEQLEQQDPELVRRLEEYMIGGQQGTVKTDRTQEQEAKKPEFSKETFRKMMKEAEEEMDVEKKIEAMEKYEEYMVNRTESKMKEMFEEHEKKREKMQQQRTQEERQQKIIEEIREIREQGDTRIDKYLRVNPQTKTSSLGTLLDLGYNPVTQKPWESVREAYSFLLESDRGGQENIVPDDVYQTMPSGGGNVGEDTTEVSESEMRKMSTREWMESFFR
jgi:hypothetical protein